MLRLMLEERRRSVVETCTRVACEPMGNLKSHEQQGLQTTPLAAGWVR